MNKLKKFLIFISFFISQNVFSQNINLNEIQEIAEDLVFTHKLDFNIIVLDNNDKIDKKIIKKISQPPSNNIYFASVYHPTTTVDNHAAPGCVIYIDSKNKYKFSLVEKDSNFSDVSYAKDFTLFFLTAHEFSHCLAQNVVSGAVDEKYADFFTYYFLSQSEYKDLIPSWLNFLKTMSGQHNTHSYLIKKQDLILSGKNIKDLQEKFIQNK